MLRRHPPVRFGCLPLAAPGNAAAWDPPPRAKCVTERAVGGASLAQIGRRVCRIDVESVDVNRG